MLSPILISYWKGNNCSSRAPCSLRDGSIMLQKSGSNFKDVMLLSLSHFPDVQKIDMITIKKDLDGLRTIKICLS